MQSQWLCIIICVIIHHVLSSNFTCDTYQECQNNTLTCYNNEDCFVFCGERACQNAIILGPNNGNLQVIAHNTGSLKSAQIYCPKMMNASCSIADSFDDLTIYSLNGLQDINTSLFLSCNHSSNLTRCYADESPPRIACGANYAINIQIALETANNEWKYVIDDPSFSCTDSSLSGHYGTTFYCNLDRECMARIITCNQNESCSIYCGNYGCSQSIIYGSTSGDLRVIAQGHKALESARVYCPPSNYSCDIISQGIHTQMMNDIHVYSENRLADLQNTLTLKCSNDTHSSNCYNESRPPRIICGDKLSTTIQMALKTAYDDWDYVIGDQSDTVLCDESVALDGADFGTDFYCNLEVLESNLDSEMSECMHRTITCNQNASCSVDCGGDYGCSQSIIQGPTNGDLSVIAEGHKALESVRVYCPPANYTCDIISKGTDTEMMNDMRVFSTNRLADLQNTLAIRCSNDTDSSNCYNESRPPRIICGANLDIFLQIALKTAAAYDDWEYVIGNQSDTVLCEESVDNAHYGATFYCPELGDMNKHKLNTCKNTNIHCNNNANCSLVCNPCQACSIYGPQNGNLVIRAWEGMGHAGHAMLQSSIVSPLYGNLEIYITGGRWQEATVNATRMLDGRFLLHSKGARTNDHYATASWVTQSLWRSGSHVYCPANGIICTMICEYYGCYAAVIHTKPDSILNITAEGWLALSGARVYCPRNGTCSVRGFNGNHAFHDLSIYTVDGLADESLTLSCEIGSRDCWGADAPPRIACASNYDVIIQITQQGTDNWRYAIENGSNISCSGAAKGYYGNAFFCKHSYDCAHTNIVCNENEDCSVYCELAGCYNSTIYGPKYGNLNLGTYMAYWQWSLDSTSFATFDASNMIEGALSLTFKGSTDATVYCPGNNISCDISCTDYGCTRFEFNPKPDSHLKIDAVGVNALQSAIINVPNMLDGGRISIEAPVVTPVKQGKLRNMKIFSENGLRDVSLSCIYSSSIAECYPDSEPIQLFCDSNYSKACNISLKQDYDEWDCVDSSYLDLCHPTLNPTYDPRSSTSYTVTNLTINDPLSTSNTVTKSPSNGPNSTEAIAMQHHAPSQDMEATSNVTRLVTLHIHTNQDTIATVHMDVLVAVCVSASIAAIFCAGCAYYFWKRCSNIVDKNEEDVVVIKMEGVEGAATDNYKPYNSNVELMNVGDRAAYWDTAKVVERPPEVVDRPNRNRNATNVLAEGVLGVNKIVYIMDGTNDHEVVNTDDEVTHGATDYGKTCVAGAIHAARMTHGAETDYIY